MVNTGKPSTGCHLCRARRIKCDETKPQCMRCRKLKKQCPGYRDITKLTRKPKNSNASASRPQSGGTITLNGDCLSQDEEMTLIDSFGSSSIDSIHDLNMHEAQDITDIIQVSRSNVNPYSPSSKLDNLRKFLTYGMIPDFNPMGSPKSALSTPVTQQAACYFLSNFVLIPEAGVGRSYFNFLVPLLNSKNSTPALSSAFCAVSLAAFGARPSARTVPPKAQAYYLQALRQIKSAVADSSMTANDTVIAAVLLLARFEQMSSSQMQIAGWSSHIDGAVSLMKARGKNIIRTPQSRELFLCLKEYMTQSCIATNQSIDSELDWSEIKEDDVNSQNLSDLNITLAQIRADCGMVREIRQDSISNIERVLELLEAAKSLESQYATWTESLPSNWDPQTVAYIETAIPDLASSLVFPGKVDSYSDLWIAYKLNISRCARLWIWNTVIRCVAWLGGDDDYRLKSEYITAARKSQALIEDIVASVRYLFGCDGEVDLATANVRDYTDDNDEHALMRGRAGLFLIWPLFTGMRSDFATEEQQIFLRGKMRFCADVLGIDQARLALRTPGMIPSTLIQRDREGVAMLS